MQVACFTPHINVSILNIPRARFNSLEALSYLQKCNNLKQMKQIHAKLLRFGLSYDQLLMRKLLQLSSSFGKLDYATVLFEQIKNPDTFTWNAMIRAYNISGSPEKALVLFKVMVCQGIPLDKFSFPFVINACIASVAFDFGKLVHALVIKMGFWGDIYVQNTMMNLYFKCENTDCACKVFDKMHVQNVVSWTTVIAGLVASGQLDKAREIFERMPSKNVVSWTAMIDGYVKNQQPIEAFNLFERMQLDNVRPNEFTVVSLIKACTEMGSLQLGKWVHDFALKNDFELGPFMGTALIDMYSKCGGLDYARRVFDAMPIRNLATWNTMITSLGVHGLRKEALDLFEAMEKASVVPDAITFVGVLSACVHMNNMEEGLKYFNLMTEQFGITPVLEHYTCMIQLYSRANKLDEIYTLEDTMSVKTNLSVAELLQESKITGIDAIQKLLEKQNGDLDFSELDHSYLSSSSQFQSSKWDAG